MAFVGGFIVIHFKGKIVGAIHFPQSGKFELVTAVAVFQIYDDETAVFSVDSADFVHIKGVLIKLDAFVKIENVQVIVNHPEFNFLYAFFSRFKIQGCCNPFSGFDVTPKIWTG